MVMTCVLTVWVASISAEAQTAPVAGYDLLETSPGTSVDLTSIGLGVVPLQGVPIAISLGNADTIMHRPSNTTFGEPQQLLVTALFMKSTSSVVFQGQNADVYVTLNNSAGVIPTTVLPQPDPLKASGGIITISGGQSTGGTFVANFAMNADIILVRAGTSVTNAKNYIAHQPAPTKTFTPETSTWSTTPPAGYPLSTTFPSGSFFPIVPKDNGPHVVTFATCQANRTGCISQP
jgi:hypothetical protein